MDSDCLIKLTKAGLKESVCKHEKVVIPQIVKKEVVEAGKAKGHPDAELIEKNIERGIMTLVKERTSNYNKGDEVLVVMFKRAKYKAIATDDTKLIRILRASGIPFISPALIIYSIYKRGAIEKATALNWLERLYPFISEEEYSVTKLLLEEMA